MHWRRKWQPTPVFLPGESQGRRSRVGCCLWGRTESDTAEAIQQQQQAHFTGGKVELQETKSNTGSCKVFKIQTWILEEPNLYGAGERGEGGCQTRSSHFLVCFRVISVFPRTIPDQCVWLLLGLSFSLPPSQNP